jgi:cysteine desulfurase
LFFVAGRTGTVNRLGRLTRTEPAYILSNAPTLSCRTPIFHGKKRALAKTGPWQNWAKNMQRIYLDHNATTPVAPEVLAAMLPYFCEEYGNPTSIHTFGQRARGAVERARTAVAVLLGARPSEIIFTSGGTESDNAALLGSFGPCSSIQKLPGVARTNDAAAGKIPGHIITTAIEHHAVLHTCQALERTGVRVTYVPVGRDGVVDPGDIRRALSGDTALITVMHANNELGTIQPVVEIGRIAAEAGVRLHTDAVQSAGKIPVDAGKLGVHLLSISGHKFGAPKGVGALFLRSRTHLDPILHGGSNGRDRRAGTENVAAIVALGKAAELASSQLDDGAAMSRMGALRDRLERGLLERIPQASVNGGAAARIPNTLNMLFPMIDSEALVIALDLAGLACSAGAACSSGAVNPSHVLTAIGLSPAEARSSVRLSLGHANTEDDISVALELIPAAVARQREVSADWIAFRRQTASFSAAPASELKGTSNIPHPVRPAVRQPVRPPLPQVDSL